MGSITPSSRASFCTEAETLKLIQPDQANNPEELETYLKLNHPVPDPAWDYAPIWASAWSLRRKAITLVNELQQTENANEAMDQQIRQRLQAISEHINNILSQLD